MRKQFDILDEEELDLLLDELKILMKDQRIFLLNGEMGSGKTTLVKRLLRSLNSEDQASSPTFSLVNEYILPSQKRLFHFDLYRLNSSEELLSIGFEEYIDSDNYCFIEWPELSKPFLSNEYVSITFTLHSELRRILIESSL
ncbi:MAG: tRNA (adenosine(37)-N6)-threonylcarbamoyltransferase complex ATPase subunit type 1 TsaE [Bacteroidota bacterium]